MMFLAELLRTQFAFMRLVARMNVDVFFQGVGMGKARGAHGALEGTTQQMVFQVTVQAAFALERLPALGTWHRFIGAVHEFMHLKRVRGRKSRWTLVTFIGSMACVRFHMLLQVQCTFELFAACGTLYGSVVRMHASFVSGQVAVEEEARRTEIARKLLVH